MKVIILTRPEFDAREADAISGILQAGVDLVHIRKPGADESRVAALIERVPQPLRSRLVVHDFHELVPRYGLKGIHLTSRRPAPMPGYEGYMSVSCHSLR